MRKFFAFFDRLSNSMLPLESNFDAKFLVLVLNPLNANFTKWSNTLKQFVGKFSTNCLSVFGHFINLALKGLSENINLRGQIFYV